MLAKHVLHTSLVFETHKCIKLDVVLYTYKPTIPAVKSYWQEDQGQAGLLETLSE